MQSFFTANDVLKFRFEEHGPVHVVTHVRCDVKDRLILPPQRPREPVVRKKKV